MNNLRILLVGKICGDDFDWVIAPPPEPEPDGTLQDVIDIANADLCPEEWQEYWLDQEREFPR